ncbi:hypothetical protein ITJ38_17410 [Agreia pratensis]|uniref:hypothetical protein n=1 Tax=Agreia pratensis TaxID=150121 RepID=UPI00188CEA47|nr:hypothetical protein [Agreia pratensis]MBF4636191.1 hypothetical protein [Agreia pratensis]
MGSATPQQGGEPASLGAPDARAEAHVATINPARLIPFIFGPHKNATLTRMRVRDGWVCAITVMNATYLWNREKTLFEVDLDRRVINVAAPYQRLSLSGQLFSLRDLRQLHSIL